MALDKDLEPPLSILEQDRAKHAQEESQSSDSQSNKRPSKKLSSAEAALRKEQNRAAQRAFRERKERHLQQLENLIKDLKDQQFVITTRFQREVQQLNAYIGTILNENHYLREVVYAFEVALSSSGNPSLLEDVKHQLHRRHYEKQGQSHPPQPSVASQHPPPGREFQTTPWSFSPQSPGALSLHHPPALQDPPHPLALSRVGPLQEAAVETTNRDVLYKAPPLFVSVGPQDGTVTAIDPSAPLSVPRPSFAPPGTHLPRHTEYTKHPTLFDELQSSLFPPGTLQSLVQNGMASPQEVVDDITLFDNMPEDAAGRAQKSTRDNHNHHQHQHQHHQQSFAKSGSTTGPKHTVHGAHRLQKEFAVLLNATPATDPNIDPMVYAIPHDARIDLIPCPKLRAQMILHQHKYDLDELYQLLIEGAICHGPPLDVHSWEFLMGMDMERIRRKVWPRKAL
ncbi:hypothetical protein BGZ70_008585 [Mortierella alpina]|uniref:BZIP domain-containing protein n=1 Tax=Mortierella alpina TaxID=64518 RepID=A0A9P6M1M9_MORAP|nr:hypothetical protein BGZ70_008585 [Mortierella alpina]